LRGGRNSTARVAQRIISRFTLRPAGINKAACAQSIARKPVLSRISPAQVAFTLSMNVERTLMTLDDW